MATKRDIKRKIKEIEEIVGSSVILKEGKGDEWEKDFNKSVTSQIEAILGEVKKEIVSDSIFHIKEKVVIPFIKAINKASKDAEVTSSSLFESGSKEGINIELDFEVKGLEDSDKLEKELNDIKSFEDEIIKDIDFTITEHGDDNSNALIPHTISFSFTLDLWAILRKIP